MRSSASLTVIAVLVATLAGCNRTKPIVRTVATETPQSMVVRVAKQMQICWFKKNDPAVRKYKLASEVNSYTGRPRLLLVPRNKPSGLPALVVQAERQGGRNNLQTFGPLLASKAGPRLSAAVNNWAGGSTVC